MRNHHEATDTQTHRPPAEPATTNPFPAGTSFNPRSRAGWTLAFVWMQVCLHTAIPHGQAATYDLVLKGGTVVDGIGTPAYRADVGVNSGRIRAVGDLSGVDADTVLDVEGKIVAPGFIDVHTHAENIVERPAAENFVRMGVTTLILGNCGSSERDIAGLFHRLENVGIGPNVATLIGHNSIRSQVMGGSFMRPPTDAEIAEMSGAVAKAMDDGALGMSTGLIYLPGTFAKTEEIIALARVVREAGGIYASHIRDEGAGVRDAMAEVIRIASEANIRAHISHIKLAGKSRWGAASEILRTLDEARSRGLELTHDQYLYTASSTGISQLIPEAAREGDDDRFLERIADPKTRASIVDTMKEVLDRRGRGDYAYAVIADYEADAELNGLNLVEATRLRLGADALDKQIEMIFEIQRHGGASAVFHGISEDDLQTFLVHPKTMIAADSSVRELGAGVPHPRGYGNNARFLARYIRELKLMPLEEGVRKMTSLPARTFGLTDRGSVAPGAAADLVVFNPATVRDQATFTEPHQYATGFAYVIVNGEIVVRDDQVTENRPGKTLRRR